MGHACSNCQDDETLDRESALAFSMDTLEDAATEALNGRVAEASALNQVAQSAIALADRLVPQEPATLTGGPH
jgi:hypothetical protein